MENKYQEGEVVYAIVTPSVKLLISYYVYPIYYCNLLTDPAQKELTYFERELLSENPGDQYNPSKY